MGATSVRTSLTVHALSATGPQHQGGQHQPWEWTEARMGVRLQGRAMLGPLVVAAINYDFVGTN